MIHKLWCICAVGLAMNAGHGLAEETISLGPVRLYPETVLVSRGAPQVVIVAPQSNNVMAQAAQKLAAGLQNRYGLKFPVVADTEVCPERLSSIGAAYRETNLLVVGNLDANRAIFPLYANLMCGADSSYPGGDGYELRTVSNPWGTGKNVIVIGGSSAAGVQAGVDEFLGQLPEAGRAEIVMPFLLKIKPGGLMAEVFAKSAGRVEILEFKMPSQTGHAVIHLFVNPAYHYYWTGDSRWAALAVKYLTNCFNRSYAGQYPVSDYEMEMLYRSWDWLEEFAGISESDRNLTARRLFETAYRNRRYAARAPQDGLQVGGMHKSMPRMAYWFMTSYFKRSFPENLKLQELMSSWENEVRSYFLTAIRGYRSDSNGQTGLDDIGVYLRWSAAAHEPEYFTSGKARQALQYCIQYLDPLGYSAGLDRYGEARMGAAEKGRNVTYHLRLGAFVYDDPGLRGLARRCSDTPSLWALNPFGSYDAAAFAVDPSKTETPPDKLQGVVLLPLSERQYAWEKQNAGRPLPPFDKTFDKIIFRSDFSSLADYLMLNGINFDGSGNVIPRHVAQGQVWLQQNTSQYGSFVRNALYVSDGSLRTPVFALAQLDAIGSFDGLGMAATRLAVTDQADWQRVLFWKPGGWTMVMDLAEIRSNGNYVLQSVWRLPVSGDLCADGLRVQQSNAVFRIQPAGQVKASAQVEIQQGGMPDLDERPFMLREIMSVTNSTDGHPGFYNLLSVKPADQKPPVATWLQEGVVSVTGTEDDAWILARMSGRSNVLGFCADSGLLACRLPHVYLAGLRKLAFDDQVLINQTNEITADLDLETGNLNYACGAEQLKQFGLTWQSPAPAKTNLMPKAAARLMERQIKERWQAWQANRQEASQSPPAPSMPEPDEASLKLLWTNSSVVLPGKCARGAQVQCGGSFSGDPAKLTDGMLGNHRASQLMVAWETGQPAQLHITWGPQQKASEIILSFAGKPLTDTRQANPTDEWNVSVRNIPQPDNAGPAPAPTARYWAEPTYKGMAEQYLCLNVPVAGKQGHGLDLEISPNSNGPSAAAKIQLAEITVLTDERGTIETDCLRVADLEHDGTCEAFCSFSDGTLAVVEQDGRTRWVKKHNGRLGGVELGDLNGDGQDDILTACYDLMIRAYSGRGQLICETSLAGISERTNGKILPDGPVPFAVGLWNPKPGVTHLVAAGYGAALVLNTRGELLGFGNAGGRAPRCFLPQGDWNDDGLKEVGFISIAYSGDAGLNVLKANAGGLLDKVVYHYGIPNGTPFVAQVSDGHPPQALVAAPSGAGCYNLAGITAETNTWSNPSNAVWETKDIMCPIAGGFRQTGDSNAPGALVLGRRDGFINVLSDAGQILKTINAGEEIFALAGVGRGTRTKYLVATADQLRLYDSAWNCLGARIGKFRKLQADERQPELVWAVTEDGVICLFQTGP